MTSWRYCLAEEDLESTGWTFGVVACGGGWWTEESGLVEDPLDGGVEERDERFVGDFAIEPEMNAGDG